MAKRSGNISVAGLALPLRVWLQRFAFVVLLALAFALMLLSKADIEFTQRTRIAIVDAVTPILSVLSRPIEAFDRGVERIERQRQSLDCNVDRALLRHRPNPDLKNCAGAIG